MAIRIVKGSLVITTKKVKPQKGDLMCCFAHGIGGVGRGHFLSYHDDTTLGRLNAICHGTEKVVFFLKFSK
jgi:hypothetical protein